MKTEYQSLDIAELTERAHTFQKKLVDIKRTAPTDFEWYPHWSLTAFQHLDKLLTGSRRKLFELAAEKPMADIACGDGDIAYFLESLGFRVQAVDHPIANHNGMAGVRALHALLHSYIEIHCLDLDTQFVLPEPRYGLVFFLGALYHLKNPFYALEHISKKADYCVLSTRIARVFPRIGRVDEVPVAYLLDANELNRDNSNYWIFSEAGLRRLLKRTNWEILDFVTVGAGEGSDPVSLDKDERAFCLLKSRWALGNVTLLDGWHNAEEAGWRWAKQEFSFANAPDGPERPSLFRMHLYIPPALLEDGPLKIAVIANGVKLGGETFTKSGDHMLERGLGKAHSKSGNLHIECRLNRALPPDDADPRELGIIVASIEFE